MRKYSAQKSVKSTNLLMKACSDFQLFDVSPQTRSKVIAESEIFSFVKEETIIEVAKGILANEDCAHRRPIAHFTSSQSRS